MQPDGYAPTARHAPSQPPPFAPPAQQPPAQFGASRSLVAIAVAVALVVGIGAGVLIGRATSKSVTAVEGTVVDEQAGHLAVASKPADGNVVVDGRFVGVAPIERLDLEPGKHSVVIDAFGYQPYSGTLEIEARGKVNLSVLLAPLGVDEATTGNVTGGVAKRAVVQRSALVPVGGSPAGAPAAPAAPPPPADVKHTKPAAPVHVAAPPPPPSRPRRDCSGEKDTCENNCRHAETDCEFSCPGCSSCTNTVGWDECNRQCSTCRQGCKSNVSFCESGCNTSYSSCQNSQ